jgi:hypothetical protein
MKELRYMECMDPRLEQLTPETIDRLAQKAQAEGLSLDAYLNVLLGLLNEGTALAELAFHGDAVAARYSSLRREPYPCSCIA